jgi:hypothetical protein
METKPAAGKASGREYDRLIRMEESTSRLTRLSCRKFFGR